MANPGEKLGRYVLGEVLGEGGMGRVYSAHDPALQRTVALKVLLPAAEGTDPGARQNMADRMIREARAAASFDHPNVVAVYDVGEDGGAVYIAMELVQGVTLADHHDLQGVPWPRRVGWLVDLALALGAAHDAGLVHRDVKPANVMIRDDGVLKVLDFGIARRNVALADTQLGGPVDDTVTPSAVLTAEGAVIGTPAYMSPEQLQGRPVDGRTDQFAWGVTAFEVLTGGRPWPLNNAMEMLTSILTTAPASLRKLDPELPKAVDAAVLKTLRPDPAERHADMQALVDVIGMFAETGQRPRPSGRQVAVAPAAEAPDPHAATEAGPASEPRSPPLRARARRPLLAGVALVSLAAVGVVFALLDRNAPAPGFEPPGSAVPEAAAAFAKAERGYAAANRMIAWKEYKRATELDPTYAAAHLRLAAIGLRSTPANAMEHYRQALLHPDPGSAWLSEEIRLLEPIMRPTSDFAERIRRLQDAWARRPADVILGAQLALAQVRGARIDDAGRTASALAGRFPDLALPHWIAAFQSRSAGERDRGIEAADRCLALSPGAAPCFRARILMQSDMGRCAGVEDDARRWLLRDPDSQFATEWLIRALRVRGAPRAAVEEVMGRRDEHLQNLGGRHVALKDRARLAADAGDFADAIAATRERIAATGKASGALDRLLPRLDLAGALYESGDAQAAADVAAEAMGLAPALTAHPFWGSWDYALNFRPYLVRAGRISADEARTARQKGLTEMFERLGGLGAPAMINMWGATYMSPGITAAEAAEALAALEPLRPLPPLARIWRGNDLALGIVHALAGEPQRAVELLEHGLQRCDVVDDPMLAVRAQLALGEARQKLGDAGGARAAYQDVLKRWGDAKPRSITAERARALLDAL